MAYRFTTESHYDTINLMDAHIPSYCAGLFDGEGSVFVYQRTKPPGYRTDGKYHWWSNLSKHYYVLRVKIVNTHQGVMQFLNSYYPGYLCGRKRNPPRKQIWEWTIEGNKATLFLETIAPYLIIKQERVQVALEFWRNKGDKRHELFNRLKALNQKGTCSPGEIEVSP